MTLPSTQQLQHAKALLEVLLLLMLVPLLAHAILVDHHNALATGLAAR